MKHIPYEYMTDKKWNSLGETMTLKNAMDLWWNSIRVRTPNKEVITCYKCYDGDYEIMGNLKLNAKITLDDEYNEDADGYPIIFATLIA